MTSNLAVSYVKALWRNIMAIKALKLIFKSNVKLFEEDIINIPGVAGAVLQTALSLIDCTWWKYLYGATTP